MAWGQDTWGDDVWGNLVGVPGAAAAPSPGAKAQKERFGADMLFDGDLELGPHNDYQLLEGEQALKQAIIHRLITSPGDFAVRPGYGVGVESFVKKKLTASLTGRLRNLIIDQLSFEPRIESISRVTVRAVGQGIEIQVSVVSAGKALTFQPFVFGDTGLRS